MADKQGKGTTGTIARVDAQRGLPPGQQRYVKHLEIYFSIDADRSAICHEVDREIDLAIERVMKKYGED